MATKFTTRQRLRYRIDASLARGIWGVLAWLGLLALAFVIVIGLLLTITGWYADEGERPSFISGAWYALTRSLDPGTVSGDSGGDLRIVGIIVTIVGIFLAAAIIGLVSSAIDNRVESMRRGRSLVVEDGHTIILGINDKLPSVIGELIEANSSERDHAIVLLCPQDPVEVGDEIRSAVGDFKSSRLVVRSGMPTRVSDVELLNPSGAKSVIVLLPDDGSDADVVKSVLALTRAAGDDATCVIVAELSDIDVADALQEAFGDRVLTVASPDVIARIGAQVARSPGLGVIYQELLDFEGDELYSTAVSGAWVGRNYGEAQLSSSKGTVVGVHFADGRTILNPAPGTVLQAGDHLIAIAEDDSVYRLDQAPETWAPDSSRLASALPAERDRTLLIGWSQLAPRVAKEIDIHVASGSDLHVLVDMDDTGVNNAIAEADLRNLTVTVHTGDSIRREAIQRALADGPFDHILILGERDAHDADESDARTMLALMQLRRALADVDYTPSVVAELLDPHGVELTGSDDGQDFIVSQRLIGLMLAQLSENPRLAPVLDDLFGSVGSAVSMEPADRYLPAGSYTFTDIVRACREWGVTAIGYKSASAVGVAGALPGGIRLNPDRTTTFALGESDSIIVLANE